MMQKHATAEQEALRHEMRAYFKQQRDDAPASWRGGLECPYVTDENWAFHRAMAKKIADKGWSATMWPAKYGGREVTPFEQIFITELAGYSMVGGIDIFANMIGPAILKYGTEEQKQFHLPKIATGEILWCQGWSEPNAGSDLAALTTRAVRNEAHYVVNGQKIWTSNAHRADWMFLAVRTDAAQKRSGGISILILDMKTVGMVVRPISSMDGDVSFNEVFFDDVQVPVENLLGEENKGWEVATSLMSYERMGIAAEIGYTKRLLDDLVDYCKQTADGKGTLFDSPRVGVKLAELVVEVEVVRSLCYELGRLISEGKADSTMALASTLKVSTTEMNQRVAYAGIEILGLVGQLEGPSEWSVLEGDFARVYQTCVGMNILGGTSEIQRNIIAWVGLGLPRS